MPHTFHDDIDRIAFELVDAFGLTFEIADEGVSEPLTRWLDFRLRYIDPRPRQVLKSTDFDMRIPSQAEGGLLRFIQKAEAGEDLNPFQSRGIKRHDTSGKKRQFRTDGLWADWGIHHAHLTEDPLPDGDEFSNRSDWLLFFIVGQDHLALIDARPHKEKFS